MISNYFETEFGDKIQMLPEIEQNLYPNLLKGREYFEEQFSQSFPNLLKNQEVPKVKIKNGYINNDLYSLGCVLDLLSELKLTKDRKFKKCLDIGGREGIHAAIFRGLYAEEVHVADITDGKDPYLTLKLLKSLYRYIPYYIIDNFIRDKYLLNTAFKKITGRTPSSILPRGKNTKHKNSVSMENFYHFLFNKTPKVDRFLIGDWFETISETYDVMLSFQNMWLWDYKIVMKKVSENLEKDGLFCTMTPYCWAGRSGLDAGYVIGGEFGYFEQRLTKNDIQKYYSKFKPDVAHLVDWGYNSVDPNRPTVQNYVDEAKKNGLIIEGVKRIYDNLRYDLISNGEIIYKNNLLNKKKSIIKIDVDEVLKNIHRFRKDVKLDDLLTRAVVMVFRKI